MGRRGNVDGYVAGAQPGQGVSLHTCNEVVAPCVRRCLPPNAPSPGFCPFLPVSLGKCTGTCSGGIRVAHLVADDVLWDCLVPLENDDLRVKYCPALN